MTESKKDSLKKNLGVDSGFGDNSDDESSSNKQPQPQSSQEVPHRVRYESPKEGRTEVQFLLDDVDSERLQELEAIAKSEFDETVYRTDVKLAGLRSGIHCPDHEFLSAMRKIGYGYFD